MLNRRIPQIDLSRSCMNILVRLRGYFQKKNNPPQRSIVKPHREYGVHEIHFQEKVDPVDRYEWDRETKHKE